MLTISTHTYPVHMCLPPISIGPQENTNKAVIADLYIHDADLASSAFAAVAFTSGVSGRGLPLPTLSLFLSLALLTR